MTNDSASFFPGVIKPSIYETQIKKKGVASSFQNGVIYRHPGIVPLLDVCGTHYEMGLQYGVLMRPEIMETLAAYQRMIAGMAANMDIPAEFLIQQWYSFIQMMAARIPQRFHEEAQGISQGSGIPLDDIFALTFAYDFAMAGGCTSVLMRKENGGIIHARNNDTSGFGGAELGRITAVVRRRPEGFHTTTQIDYPLLLGIETGYNDQGLAFSEETYRLREPDPDRFSLNILVRLIMEECSTLEELPAYFNRYPVLAGYGEVWSSRHEARGWLVEKTPYGWTKQELTEDILWNFNTIGSPELKEYEQVQKTLRNDDDREAVARAYPRKETYTPQDAINFLRSAHDGAREYIHFGTRRGICNIGTQQSMVFDPHGQGVYLSWGEQYCSRAIFYYIHEDFSRPPTLFSPAIPITEKMLRMCDASFQLVKPSDKMPAFLSLAEQYPEDADFQFQVAHLAFSTDQRDLFLSYAEKTYQLQPEVAEYRLYAGIAAFWRGAKEIAAQLLETFTPGELFLQEELYRLSILEQLSPDPGNVRAQIDVLLSTDELTAHHQEHILPRIQA